MADNNGLLFYKMNYSRITGEVINSVDNNSKIESSEIMKIDLPEFSNTFMLETTYPGLLMGTGYTHHAKDDSDAFKIGFFFDHTTGMPVVPGSSLKGVLRSVFPQFEDKDIKKIKNGELPSNAKSIVKAKWISALVDEILKDDFNKKEFLKNYFMPNEEFSDFMLIHKLELELFETARNVFYDVTPLNINGANIDRESRLFANDYITPHYKNPLRNPEPIKFLKVLPKVVYQFCFNLKNSILMPELKKDKIELLFQKILLTIGIGAKTNVGYGQFTFADNAGGNNVDENSFIDSQKEKEIKEILEKHLETEKNKTEAEKRLVNGEKIDCTVIAKDKTFYTFGVDWDENLTFTKKIDNIKIALEVGDKVVVEIIEDYYISHKVSFSKNVTKI